MTLPREPLYIERMLPEQIAAVERRMRDRGFSHSRFLGPRESLTARVRADAEVLQELGITHERMARRLEAIVRVAGRAADKRVRDPKYEERTRLLIEEGGLADLEKLALELGKLEAEARAVVVAQRFLVDITHYMGWQYCPFDYREDFSYEEIPGVGRVISGGTCGSCGRTDYDVDIKNLVTGSSICFSGLIIHLIREHQFFEGKGLPYRLDPKQAAETLDLIA